MGWHIVPHSLRRPRMLLHQIRTDRCCPADSLPVSLRPPFLRSAFCMGAEHPTAVHNRRKIKFILKIYEASLNFQEQCKHIF